MLGSLGWQELLIILAILALLFGASRVGDLGKSLGRGIREFRTEATSKDGKDNDRPAEAGASARPAGTTPTASVPPSTTPDDRSGTGAT